MSVPMELSRIVITELGGEQMIILKEKEGDRSFPIMIGTNEAVAIDRRLKGQPTQRPMTHDLLANVIEALGGRLEKILINDLRDHVFYAKIHLNVNGRSIEIDSRPSDAIAVSVASSVPIFVAEHVFDSL